MGYVAPNTVIYLCSGVPLDNKYRDTIYFTTQTNQLIYFEGKVKYMFDSHSYQRVGTGKIRVAELADNLYDCNYLYFQNTNFGDKWFFAFVTGVEYVNNGTSEVSYEIDVLQTWHFDYKLGYCFVEREHVTDDTIGANVIAEPINFGDMKCVELEQTNSLANYSAIIATGYDADDSTPGAVYSNIPSGLNYLKFNAEYGTSWARALDYLQAAVDDEKDDAIVAIWMQPTEFSTLEEAITDNCQTITIDCPTTIDGYSPKNNKLFTYPYSYLGVDSGNETAIYRYEWFAPECVDAYGGYPFYLVGVTCPNPEIQMAPMGYCVQNSQVHHSGSYNDTINFSEGLTMRDFPQIAWASDAYRAWVANGGYYSAALNIAGSAAGAGISALQGNTAGVISGMIGVAQTINTAAHEANHGATGHGIQGGTAAVAGRTKDFYFKKMQIQYDYAMMIDDYFTRYGYQVNKVKVPSRNGRTRWNYVKTSGCIVLADAVPGDDISKIESIYDNGVTFWMSGSYVGHYSETNSIS